MNISLKNYWSGFYGLVLILALSAACGEARAAAVAESPGSPNRGNLYYADVIHAAAKFDEVILWEGLPHYFEKTSRAHELTTKETFTIGEEAFYARPLPLKDEEKTMISDSVLKHMENFKAWSGFKFCGGFHADYAIEWKYQGQTVAQALFCFSCHEAQFRVGDRVEQVDQSDEGNKRFRELLLSHRQQRPAFQTEPAKSAANVAPVEPVVSPKVEIERPAMPVEPPPKIEIQVPPSNSPVRRPE